ncbi:MAG TPA: ATP-dependent DNA ligase [Gemmatimonadaceae bacterium]|nr:ATP-dependent DNA ligase [Gemmatimonadaceae bacterium]
MRRFTALYAELDITTKTGIKVAAMARYFAAAPARDAAWAVYLLSGGRPRRVIGPRRLAEWAMAAADTPPWLFEESYAAVGDLAETIGLLLPPATTPVDRPLHEWMEQRLLPLTGADEATQRAAIVDAWNSIDGPDRCILVKLLTGGFHVGVSQGLVVRALVQATGVAAATLTHRLSGHWDPTATDAYVRLVAQESHDADLSRPYPFCLAHQLDRPPDDLGDLSAWQVEWKWDGIRVQVIRRRGKTFIWSRGDESIADQFPEIAMAAAAIPDGTVIDGEIVAWSGGAPLGFAALQRRIGRTTLSAKLLAQVPAALIAYDLLEHEGLDVRGRPLAWRREALNEYAGGHARLLLSPTVDARDWVEATTAQRGARDRGAEGLMLKRRDSVYGVGRTRDAWWKWKLEPYTVDAVMVYAQAGYGRRALLHTDYTLAVWDGTALVPFAKAYSGLTDAELTQLDNWIRRNTVEKFGPVRMVKAEQVFEVGFEGIQRSSRHKSGLAVRFPRILRWRTDKRPEDADTLATVRALIAP